MAFYRARLENKGYSIDEDILELPEVSLNTSIP